MMDIQPTDLRYFFEVAKSLNISRAAERLGIGQPALSQAIQRLERNLGTKVFDRFKTGVQLTAVGHRLLSEGKSAIDIWDRLKSGALAVEHEIQGYYSIGCHTAIAQYALPAFLRNLLSHPDLNISLHHGLSREILEDVISFRIDFGLVMNPIVHPDLIIRSLCEDRVSFYKVNSALESTLIFDPSLSQSQILIRKLSDKGKFLKYLHSSSLELIACLADKGCGIAILPERVARTYPSLVLMNKDLPFVRDRLCLVYRADRHKTASARVIIDTILRSKI